MAAGKKTGGRQKGTPNKTTASVKEALTQAFDELGGVEALVRYGMEEPGEFYKLWVKVLPQEVNHGVQTDNPIMSLIQKAQGTVRKFGDDQ